MESIVTRQSFMFVTCSACALRFAVPKELFEKLHGGGVFYCPVGHSLTFAPPKPPPPPGPTQEQRDELTLAKHKAEQLEGKVVDLQATLLARQATRKRSRIPMPDPSGPALWEEGD